MRQKAARLLEGSTVLIGALVLQWEDLCYSWKLV